MGPAVEETLRRAMSAIQSQRPDEALRLTQDILNKNPSQPNALHLYGYALLMQGRADEAVAPLEKAFRSLRDPAIETQLAIALRKAGRTDDALSRLARAVKRKPPFPAAFHEYGYLLHSLDRTDEAIDVIKAGMEAAPWMPDLPCCLVGFFMPATMASAPGQHSLAPSASRQIMATHCTAWGWCSWMQANLRRHPNFFSAHC